MIDAKGKALNELRDVLVILYALRDHHQDAIYSGDSRAYHMASRDRYQTMIDKMVSAITTLDPPHRCYHLPAALRNLIDDHKRTA